MPRTEAEWREGRRVLAQRLAMAKERVAYAKSIGDEFHEDIHDREVDEAKEELERYEARTTDSRGGAIAVGAVLCAAGVGAIALAVAAGSRGGVESPSEPDEGLAVGFGIGGGLFLASGVAVIVLGTRKGWTGPPDDGATATVGVGPGSVSVRGGF
jgi:hypothetical protein